MFFLYPSKNKFNPKDQSFNDGQLWSLFSFDAVPSGCAGILSNSGICLKSHTCCEIDYCCRPELCEFCETGTCCKVSSPVKISGAACSYNCECISGFCDGFVCD